MSIALLFPGQGAQTVGMGKELYESSPAAKSVFDRANQILGYDLTEICFNGPMEKLNSTNYSQPALFVSSMAVLASLEQNDPVLLKKADFTAGLSLGEYTAVVFAEAITFEDGLELVQIRGNAMQEAADEVPSSMVSVLGLDLESVRQVCDEARHEGEILQVANLLCPGNIVVSGHKTACQRVAAVATEAGAMRSIELAVAGAFHTPLMESAVAKLTAALNDVIISSPRIPVVSNVDGHAHTSPDEIRDLLIRQVCSPVQWHPSMELLIEKGVDEFYEIGTGTVLRGLLKRINRKIPCHSISGS